MPKTAAWRAWLKDDDFRRWHERLARRNRSTADERARVLYRFVTQHAGLGPDGLRELIRLAEGDKASRKQLKDRLHDTFERLQDTSSERTGEPRGGGSMKEYKKAIHSWLSYHDVPEMPRDWWPTIKDAEVTKVSRRQKPLTPEQVQEARAHADPRQKVDVDLMAYAGCRPDTISDGVDGLRVSDFPDLVIRGRTVEFKNVPALGIVRPEICKTGCRHPIFLPPEACQDLKAYLERRIANGEAGGPDSPIHGGEILRRAGTRFVDAKAVSKQVKQALLAAGLPHDPYALRRFFEARLQEAQAAKLLDPNYRTLIAGHKGNMDDRYAFGSAEFPPSLLAQMREQYAASASLLTGSAGALEPVDLTARVDALVADRVDEAVRAALTRMAQGKPSLNTAHLVPYPNEREAALQGALDAVSTELEGESDGGRATA